MFEVIDILGNTISTIKHATYAEAQEDLQEIKKTWERSEEPLFVYNSDLQEIVWEDQPPLSEIKERKANASDE